MLSTACSISIGNGYAISNWNYLLNFIGIFNTQLIRFSEDEKYEEIKEDLQNLLRLKIDSMTVDGHKETLKAIREVLTETKI